jgi:hypothetical protein
MKTLIISLTIFLVCSQAFGQKKSKEEAKDAQIAALTQQLDSVSKQLVKYVGVYDTLRVKVIHYNFDPAKTTILIDSLAFLRSSMSSQQAIANVDSIAKLNKEIQMLKAVIESNNNAAGKPMVILTQKEMDQLSIINSLKQLRELADTKILTEAEFITLKKKYLDKL